MLGSVLCRPVGAGPGGGGGTTLGLGAEAGRGGLRQARRNWAWEVE